MPANGGGHTYQIWRSCDLGTLDLAQTRLTDRGSPPILRTRVLNLGA